MPESREAEHMEGRVKLSNKQSALFYFLIVDDFLCYLPEHSISTPGKLATAHITVRLMLRLIKNDGECTPDEVSLDGLHHYSKSALSRAITALVRDGLLSIKEHATDKRRNVLKLTAKGRGLLQKQVGKSTEAILDFAIDVA